MDCWRSSGIQICESCLSPKCRNRLSLVAVLLLLYLETVNRLPGPLPCTAVNLSTSSNPCGSWTASCTTSFSCLVRLFHSASTLFKRIRLIAETS